MNCSGVNASTLSAVPGSNHEIRKAIKQFCLFTATILAMVVSSQVFASDKNLHLSCRDIIAVDADSEEALQDIARYEFLEQERSLLDLVSNNPETNLVVQHPWIAMNAWQRLWTMLHSMGVERVPHPDRPGKKIPVYRFFEAGAEQTGGRKIVGHYEAKARMASVIKASGTGDAASRSLNILVGPAGSGKTELIEVLREAYRYFMVRNPDFFLYSIVFKNLNEIPALKKWLQDEYGHVEDFVPPYPQFPLAILPKAFQKSVIKMAEPRVAEMTGGMKPRPFTDLSTPLDQIRDMILEHYHQIELASPGERVKRTPQERLLHELAILDKHVKLRRIVLAAPKIDGKDTEVNWRKLLLGENPGFVLDPNKNNPFKIDYGGKVPNANGGAILWDEYLRNGKKLRDATLGIIESNEINSELGESPKLDIAAFAASNNESLVAVRGEASSKAQLSRMRLNQMPWPIWPHEVAEVILLVNKRGTYMQKLGVPEADADGVVQLPEVKPINLSELFPMRQYGKRTEGSDRRYALFVGEGPSRITIQPHALMFMSYVTALTHLSFEVRELEKKMPNSSIKNSTVFRDGIARLKALTYRIETSKEDNYAEWRELMKASTLLGEGHFGLDMRHVAKNWFPLALELARDNANTLTVAVAREAFEQLLNREEDIVVPDNNARLTWLGYADRVIVDLIVPEMRRDIMRAWGAEEGNARRIYDMLLKELMNSSGRGPSERLKDVMKFYLEVNREPLVPANITEFLARAQERLLETGGKGFVDEPHPGLMEAIHEYLADQQSKIVPLTVIADSIAGIETDAASSEVREAFKKVMIHELGYASDRAIADAIATVDEVLSKKEELESR